jgi:hypothetical protein
MLLTKIYYNTTNLLRDPLVYTHNIRTLNSIIKKNDNTSVRFARRFRFVSTHRWTVINCLGITCEKISMSFRIRLCTVSTRLITIGTRGPFIRTMCKGARVWGKGRKTSGRLWTVNKRLYFQAREWVFGKKKKKTPQGCSSPHSYLVMPSP